MNDLTAAVPSPRPLAVIGLGYIGLPLALSLAGEGHRVIGVDTSPDVRQAIVGGTPLFHEPGVTEALATTPADLFSVADQLPDEPLQAVILCVGTAVDPKTHRPDLRHLESAAAHVAEHLSPDTLVVVRSTVSVGTCRQTVLPLLARSVAQPLLASCPERTIQGVALHEIRSLPQIIGGIDERSVQRAAELLSAVCPDQVTVSSIEASELVKLICNAHTDLIYGFGNEIAALAEGVGLDANEVIAAANLRYPRPDLSRPGFVGGSCLVKDPYLLLDAGRSAGWPAPMVAAARQVNESVPHRAVARVVAALEERGTPLADAKVLVCGVAYKGRPETDDVRGSAAVDVAASLGSRVRSLVAHDFVVTPERISSLGFVPTGLDDGLADADAVIVLVDHPGYQELTADRLLTYAAKQPVVFDMWGITEPELAAPSARNELTYLRLGRG
ncbi:nucleotide sugar dehydrogenase [Streptomyces sp. NPDC002790]|uniref:nucleotide sugar dehydrogenase n=1 Tax=Streptomyces sp. NPDC002790 TaxID=3154431 RepID=UPI0033263B6E